MLYPSHWNSFNIGTDQNPLWLDFYFSADCIHLLKRIRIRLLFGRIKFGCWRININKYKEKIMSSGIVRDKRVFDDTPSSKMMDEFALKLFSKNVINYLI